MRLVEEDYNDVETYGARAALKIELDDNWTVTPQVMGQQQKSYGSFAQESGLDELQVQQFNPEHVNDRWIQAALTIEGKIGNFDMTYAGSYLKRQDFEARPTMSTTPISTTRSPATAPISTTITAIW